MNEAMTSAIASALYAITQALDDDSYETEDRACRDLGLAETYLMDAIRERGSNAPAGEADELLIFDALRELRKGVGHLVEARRRLEAWERIHHI